VEACRNQKKQGGKETELATGKYFGGLNASKTWTGGRSLAGKQPHNNTEWTRVYGGKFARNCKWRNKVLGTAKDYFAGDRRKEAGRKRRGKPWSVVKESKMERKSPPKRGTQKRGRPSNSGRKKPHQNEKQKRSALSGVECGTLEAGRPLVDLERKNAPGRE